MIPIKKGSEPSELTKLREENAGLSPKEAYEQLRNPLKKKVRQQLVDEQGGLCAYCMCRIPRLDAPAWPGIVIEHIVPRNPADGRDIGQGLDYNNLLAVCHGNRGPSGTREFADLTCDAHRKNTEFRKVNPCCPETLQSIFYHLDGRIDASDPDVRFDLVDTLNLNSLNAPILNERKAALDSLFEDLGAIEAKDLMEYCEILLNTFSIETNPKTPYVGILIWYLQLFLASNT